MAGYRPCKRCRPELAPGNSAMEVSSQLARSTAALIGQDFLADHSLEELAGKLGVTDRHMRRVFQDEFGVSPVEYLQTQQVVAGETIADRFAAVGDGGGDGERISKCAAFQRGTEGTVPADTDGISEAAKKIGGAEHSSEFSFRLGYRPPLDWERLLGFLARRAIPQVEAVQRQGLFSDGALEPAGPRIFRVSWKCGMGGGRQRVISVRLSDSLVPVCARWCWNGSKRLFDLQADPLAIGGGAGSSLAEDRPGLRVPGSFDGFEMAVRAILGQQVSVAGASTLWRERLAARFRHARLELPVAGLGFIFSRRRNMNGAGDGGAGDRQTGHHRKTLPETLIALAQAVQPRANWRSNRELTGWKEHCGNSKRIPGIGEWTAQYLAMRALSWPDAFPHTDLGLRKAALGGNQREDKFWHWSEKWRPWQSIRSDCTCGRAWRNKSMTN